MSDVINCRLQEGGVARVASRAGARLSRVSSRAVLLALALTMSACGSEEEREPPSEEDGFGMCPIDLPGSTRGRRCAVEHVPLRWDEPDGETIELLVARYQSDTPGRGQLWLLDGGPGGTGALYMVEQVRSLYASLGLDLYIPQHRGTGHSTPLDCANPDDFPACGAELQAAWGEGLRGFHSTEAGRDVGFLVERTRAADEPVFVFGLSYGSYWAQRYLQAFPNQADGVILEGVFPLEQPLWQGDVPADGAGRSIFQLCRDEPACAEVFGDADPEEVARSVVTEADDPEVRCFGEEGVARVDLEFALSVLIMADIPHVVPGLMRRLDRCAESDREELLALAAFFDQAFGTPPDPGVDNRVLGVHVVRSDLMSDVTTFPLEEMLAAREPLIFWSGAAPSEAFAAIADGWPVVYPTEPTGLDGLETPLLLLNGGLDIQTPSPWARELAAQLDAPLVEFPFVGHGVEVSLANPVGAADASCSLGIIGAFLENPTGQVDGSCAETAYVPDVAGQKAITQAIAQAIYGRETPLLGADEEAGPQPKRRLSPERQRELESLTNTLRGRVARAARELRSFRR